MVPEAIKEENYTVVYLEQKAIFNVFIEKEV